GGGESPGEGRTAAAAGQGDDSPHCGIQPTKQLLRRLNAVTDRVWAVIVARVGNGAKSRLAGALSPSQRRTLALAMLGDVVDVCMQARDVLAGTLAVVDESARYVVLRAGRLLFGGPVAGDFTAAIAPLVRSGRR